MRGKYRQFFLRVTAENVDEFISANLVVKPDRTLDIVVETLLPPGALPPPPQIPQDLRSSTPESAPQSPVMTERQNFYGAFPGQANNYGFSAESRLQQSLSARSSDRGASPYCSSRTGYSSRESTVMNVNPVKRSSAVDSSSNAEPEVTKNLSEEYRGYESPGSDEEPEELHETISKAIDVVMQKDPGWVDFFRAKAAPQRASDVLKQYQFVQRMTNEWVGKRSPFKSHHIIEASHIIRALRIDDLKFSSACTETLALFALYGPGGTRYEDSRIVAMVNDMSIPEYNAKPIKRMLHLLRDIDESWKRDRQQHPSPDAGGARRSTEESRHAPPP